jgi:hypothetical protein
MFATAKSADVRGSNDGARHFCKVCRRALTFLRLRGKPTGHLPQQPDGRLPPHGASLSDVWQTPRSGTSRSLCVDRAKRFLHGDTNRKKNPVMTYRVDYRRADGARYRPCIRLLVMLAQIGVKRLRSGLSQQCLEHHVPAPTLRKMLAIGLSQRLDAGVAVLLVDAAGRIAMPSIQALLGLLSHVTLPKC